MGRVPIVTSDPYPHCAGVTVVHSWDLGVVLLGQGSWEMALAMSLPWKEDCVRERMT